METRQTVVVTGASVGIGRATAAAFARQGARVALLARSVPGLRAAQREVEAAGGQALVLPVDISDSAQVEAAADEVERVFGPIDVWVNNAMATLYSPLDDINPADFLRVTEVSYLGTVWGTMAALRRMRPRNHGVIVQVGSALSPRSIPLQTPYCGAKAAVRGFTDALRGELVHDHSKVRLTMVQLAAFNTPQFDWCSPTGCVLQAAGPASHPEIAARAIVRASGGQRSEWRVGWPMLVKALLGPRPHLPQEPFADELAPRRRPASPGLSPAGLRSGPGMPGERERGVPMLLAGAALAGMALFAWWREHRH